MKPAPKDYLSHCVHFVVNCRSLSSLWVFLCSFVKVHGDFQNRKWIQNSTCCIRLRILKTVHSCTVLVIGHFSYVDHHSSTENEHNKILLQISASENVEQNFFAV